MYCAALWRKNFRVIFFDSDVRISSLVSFPTATSVSGLCGDYRLQPQDKGTMIEHRRTPFELDRARNIAAEIPVSTLQCCFSDLRDWLTRTSSHVPLGEVSDEINHEHVETSISVLRARRNLDARREMPIDRYRCEILFARIYTTCSSVLSEKKSAFLSVLQFFSSASCSLFLSL